MPRCPACHRRLARGTPCPTDGARPAAPLAPPDHVAAPAFPLRIGRVLGRGGSAIVWEAWRDGAPPLALKVSRAAGPAAAARFRREADVLERIGPPFVPALHEAGRLPDGRPYLVMERLRGSTLAARLAVWRRPPELDAVREVGGAILDALAALHARGVVHRDLKPENVFVARAGGRTTATLIDFGLAASPAAATATAAPAGATGGTPEYVAPEQLRPGRGVDERADLYAFGVLLYELLTLRVPFAGDGVRVEWAHRALAPPPPSAFASVPPALEALVLWCLAKDPARRPPSVAALARAFHRACARARAAADLAGEAGGAPVPPRAEAVQQQVIVLLVDVDAEAPELDDVLARHGGWLARSRRGRHVAVFPAPGDPPVEDALAAAVEAVRGGRGRAALHLATAVVRPGRGATPTVCGLDVDRPERWLPAPSWQGIVVTDELARAAPPPRPHGEASARVVSSTPGDDARDRARP